MRMDQAPTSSSIRLDHPQLDDPQLIDTSRLQTAAIRLKIPGRDMPNHMGPAMQELMATIREQGLEPAGPVYSFHFRMPSDTFDMEVGIPVSGEVKPAGRVIASELPATAVLRTTYHGPYEGLADAWGAFMKQVEASGHKTQACFWESYVSGPESGTDSSQWRTELNRPVLE